MSKNRKTGLGSIMLVITMMICVPEIAIAQNGSFYVGTSVGAEHISFEHAKTVDNTGVPANYLQRGNIYNTSASASESGFSTGFLVGYRLNLDPGNIFSIGLEIDGQLHGGTASGTFPGDGQSDSRNQYGEAWPDEWSVERKNSYGAALVFRVSPSFMVSLLGPDTGIYVLGRVRRLDADLTVNYNGCFNPLELCGLGEFDSGIDSHDETFHTLTVGGGLEKMIGDRLGIRGEVHHTQYGEEERGVFLEEEAKVPISLDGSETGFSVKAILYF
ncbi:MAG: outer membrane beta-barrel protein [Bacteroidetes bacterium]|nr:outer membrane beta-barrel protein [Bacteroidota bacterium]